MTHFHNINGIMHVEDIPLTQIAKDFRTPCYVYSANHIRSQYNALKNAMQKALPAEKQPLLCYACKANSNTAILKILEKLGSGLEIVSEGELIRGLKSGFTGDRIISTSFGKNENEIRACLEAGLMQFNIESPEELNKINIVAQSLNKNADVVFRLNPNISGGGHGKISTGRKEDKFGNTSEDIIRLYKQADSMKHITPVGVSIHIGSQITQVEAFKPGFKKLAQLVKDLRSNGLNVTHLDIGGGFPIAYNGEELLDLDLYAQWVAQIILPLDVKIQMEPGRYMVGNSGVLLTKVEYIKITPSKEFLVLDAGMNDLIRPTLYEAYHNIRPVIQNKKDTEEKSYDVVGPICESGDIFGKERKMQSVEKDDLVVIESAGAYGYAMASNYNSRPMPPEVLVDGGKVALISSGQTFEDLISRENIPDWL